MNKPHIAVVGAGIVGICSAYFLNKSGFDVTLIDKNEPGSMTSYGHACTFADYACIPVNSPNLFREIPSMLFRGDGPLAVDFFYIIRNFPWALSFLKNCTTRKVDHICNALGGLLNNASTSYDEIFSDVNVSKYINNTQQYHARGRMVPEHGMRFPTTCLPVRENRAVYATHSFLHYWLSYFLEQR